MHYCFHTGASIESKFNVKFSSSSVQVQFSFGLRHTVCFDLYRPSDIFRVAGGKIIQKMT